MVMIIPSIDDFFSGNVAPNWKLMATKGVIELRFEEEVDKKFFHFLKANEFKHLSEKKYENETQSKYSILITAKEDTFTKSRTLIGNVLRRALQLKLLFSEINDQKQFKKFKG